MEGHAADNQIVAPPDSLISLKIDKQRFHIFVVPAPGLFIQGAKHPFRAVGCGDAVHAGLEQEC